jgi:hypothetical protein
MQGFIDELTLKRFAIYIFDYGEPIGLRLAIYNPEKITGIISQNGMHTNRDYLTGAKHDTKENRDVVRNFFTLEGLIFNTMKV